MHNKIIAFDIGGTSVRAAIVQNNKVCKYLRVPTSKEKPVFLHQIENFIEELISKDVIGIGIACPSPIKNGIVKNPPNIPLKDFNLKAHLEHKFKKKVEVANDAGCVALAEARLGCKKKSFFILTLGTGIGGGIIINGEPYRGTGYGAELGHILIDGKDMESLWKETRASIEREFKEKLLIKDLVELDTPKARKILEQASQYLGEGIASLINALDPEIVIISGGIKESGEGFLDMIRAQVKKYDFLPKKTPIAWTSLEHPGILGASLLIHH